MGHDFNAYFPGDLIKLGDTELVIIDCEKHEYRMNTEYTVLNLKTNETMTIYEYQKDDIELVESNKFEVTSMKSYVISDTKNKRIYRATK